MPRPRLLQGQPCTSEMPLRRARRHPRAPAATMHAFSCGRSAVYLNGVVGGATPHSSRLGDGVSDRSAVLQRVEEVDHLVAVVGIASVGGPRRRWEAVPLLPQPQRVYADVEHRGCFVDRERGSTLLLRLYRQPRSIPLALLEIADHCRTGPKRRTPAGRPTRPSGHAAETRSGHRVDLAVRDATAVSVQYGVDMR
jgi:hypothetical protein